MAKQERFRVLLMCKACDKVYNGSPFVPYDKAVRICHSTLLNNTDVCKECEEPLIAEIQDREKPKDESNKNS